MPLGMKKGLEVVPHAMRVTLSAKSGSSGLSILVIWLSSLGLGKTISSTIVACQRYHTSNVIHGKCTSVTSLLIASPTWVSSFLRVELGSHHVVATRWMMGTNWLDDQTTIDPARPMPFGTLLRTNYWPWPFYKKSVCPNDPCTSFHGEIVHDQYKCFHPGLWLVPTILHSRKKSSIKNIVVLVYYLDGALLSANTNVTRSCSMQSCWWT